MADENIIERIGLNIRIILLFTNVKYKKGLYVIYNTQPPKKPIQAML